MTIEMLNTKKNVLLAQRGALEQAIANLGQQREQAVANLNATIGAVAVCDELIAETLAEQSKVAARDIAAEAVRLGAEEAPAPAPEPVPGCNTTLKALEPAPEMLPVEKFVQCPECATPQQCEDLGCLPPR